MDIERQNFMNEVEVEIRKQKRDSLPTELSTEDEIFFHFMEEIMFTDSIQDMYNECKTRFGSTLEKLKD